MTKEGLLRLLSDILSREGFKRKGNNWVDNRGEISKIVNLQKSEFGNLYYINYGFVIKNLPLNRAKMHIYLRVSTAEPGKRDTVGELLMFDNEIPDNERYDRLTEVLASRLIPALRAINTESDVKQKIVDGSWLNIAPLKLKQYFGLA